MAICPTLDAIIRGVSPLEFSMLTFTTFFRMTSFTVSFGLFNGLCFLPVMLTVLGSDNLVLNEAPTPAGDVDIDSKGITNQAFSEGKQKQVHKVIEE